MYISYKSTNSNTDTNITTLMDSLLLLLQMLQIKYDIRTFHYCLIFEVIPSWSFNMWKVSLNHVFKNIGYPTQILPISNITNMAMLALILNTDTNINISAPLKFNTHTYVHTQHRTHYIHYIYTTQNTHRHTIIHYTYIAPNTHRDTTYVRIYTTRTYPNNTEYTNMLYKYTTHTYISTCEGEKQITNWPLINK